MWTETSPQKENIPPDPEKPVEPEASPPQVLRFPPVFIFTDIGLILMVSIALNIANGEKVPDFPEPFSLRN
jgi:hypothetical protein